MMIMEGDGALHAIYELGVPARSPQSALEPLNSLGKVSERVPLRPPGGGSGQPHLALQAVCHVQFS